MSKVCSIPWCIAMAKAGSIFCPVHTLNPDYMSDDDDLDDVDDDDDDEDYMDDDDFGGDDYGDTDDEDE